MKKIILMLAALFIFSVFNLSIYQKEKIKASTDIVYLKLAPIDPRSLMQGDYMEFRYALSDNHHCPQKNGYAVIRLDSKNIGTFARCYAGEALQSREKLLHYTQQYGNIRIVPDSFMFQEGLAPLYQHAQYGVFKFAGTKDYLLVGLADDKLQMIGGDQ